MSFSKIFRTLIVLFAIAAVVVSQGLFYIMWQKSEKLNEIKPKADAMFLEWAAKNDCSKNPQPCEDYSKQFNDWISEFQKYKERKEQKPEFQTYFSLRELDKEYTDELQNFIGPIPSFISPLLSASSLVLLIASFLIATIMGKKEDHKNLYQKPEPKLQLKSEPQLRLKAESHPEPKLEPQSEPEPQAEQKKNEPDIQALIQKATECADSIPAQAISYLEQALGEKISDKLRNPTLLLCGSIRLKNKIGEAQGREQLQKIIGASPESSEAKEAQRVLDTYK